MGWKITDWEDFEPPKRSDRDHSGAIPWWKCPTSQNRRYKTLLGMSNGLPTVAIWYAIVASWGRQTEASRIGGVLRTPCAGDRPATLEELATDTLISPKKLKAAIHNLLQIGWLSEVATAGTTTGMPDGCQSVAETRLEKTRLEKTREDKEEGDKPSHPFIEFPNFDPPIEYVYLTEQQYQKLCDKRGKAIVDAKIARLDDWLCHNPKKRQGRDCYRTLNTWLEKDQNANTRTGSGKVAATPGKYAGVAREATGSQKSPTDDRGAV